MNNYSFVITQMTGIRILGVIICCTLLLLAVTYAFTGTVSAIAYQSAPVESFGKLSPVLSGDSMFKENVVKSLAYLQQDYPDNYSHVIYWIAEIKPTDTYTRIDNNGICYINEKDADASYYWLAGVLVHEAQHTQDDNSYFLSHSYTARESEARALEVQATYLGSVDHWTKEQVQSWIDGYLGTNYWETIPVKYGDAPL